MGKLFAVLAAVLAAYAILLAKPELYFSKSINYKNFTVRAHGEAPAGIEASLDAALEKLAASELYRENDTFEVIVPKSPGEFKLFTPFQSGEYSRVNPMHGAIFLAAADFSKGEAHSAPGSRDFRKLSSEIAGAAAVDQARRRMQALSYVFRTDWEIHGYAAKVSGLTGDFAPSDACGAADTPDLRDYKLGLMLETIMKEDQTSFADLLGRKMSREQAEIRLKRTHCGG